MKLFYLSVKKYDLVYLAVILIIMTAGFYFFGRNIYAPYSDIGREFYIPYRMSQGIVLNRDIINIYGPLGYFINTLLLKIAGSGVNVFLFLGFILSYLSLILIFKINTFFLNKNISFLLTLCFIPSCVFYPSNSNWITPYSYSILWALFGILISIYCLFKYLHNDKFIYLFLTFLFYGFSVSCKYDFAFFIILLLMIICIKRIKINRCLILLFSFLIFPVLSIIILFLQKCSINDIYESYKYINELVKSDSVKYFYHFYGFVPSVDSFKNAIYSVLNLSAPHFFRITGYISFIFIINYFITFIKNKKLTQKDFIILCYLLTGFLTSIKCIGGIALDIYGTYFLPILLSSVFTVIYNIFSSRKTVLYILCLLFFVVYTINCVQKNTYENVNIGKLNIKINPIYINATTELDNYINENISKNKTLLILPEGSIINFAEEIKSNDKYFNLNPVYAEMYGMDNVMNNIITNEPDYIAVSNLLYTDYPDASFKKTYGKKLYEYIKEKYQFEKTAGNQIQFEIYKLKK